MELCGIVITLVYTPLTLRMLGQHELGLYQMIRAVVLCLNLLNLGFSGAYVFFYSRYKRVSEEEVAQLNGIYLTFFGIVSILCVAAGVVMAFGAKRIFPSAYESGELSKARFLLALMICGVVLEFMTSVFACYITANEQFVFQKTVGLVTMILNPLLSIALIYMGLGSAGMAWSTVFFATVNLCAAAWFCFIRLKMKFSFRGIGFERVKEVWSFTSFNFLSQMIDQLCSSSDSYLLGRIVGTGSVFCYGIGAQFNNITGRFSSVIVSIYKPTASRMVAEDADGEEITALLIQVGRVQFMIQCLLFTGFLFFGKTFLWLWLGSGYEDSYIVALVLLGSVFVPRIQGMGQVIQMATRRHKAKAVIYSVIGIGNIAVSIPLIYAMGTTGAAVGTALSLIFGNVLFMNWYYHKRMGLNMFAFWKSILGFARSLLPAVICGAVIYSFVSIGSVPALFFWAAVYTAIYGGFVYLGGMNREERLALEDMRKSVVDLLRGKRKDKEE